jgi:hypothetical protein
MEVEIDIALSRMEAQGRDLELAVLQLEAEADPLERRAAG